MEKLTVLSPHRDDSSFSLGLTLSLLSAAAIKLHVLNFFTQSAYAPHSSAVAIEDISAIREEEDRKALAFIHKDIEVASLGLLDAPLRLNLPFSQITQERSTERISCEELHHLSEQIRQHCAGDLVVAPLGLGNHVDHTAVHKAAISSLPSQNLAFYEDLPYVTWTPTADLQACIESVERATGIQLEPLVFQTKDAARQKRQMAGFYQSQITADEADNIAQYAEIYGGGERLWLPVKSESWKAIRLLATESLQRAIPYLPR